MLTTVRMTLREANDFVQSYHRHNKRTSRDGGIFAIGVSDGERLVGVAIVGRPVARLLDTGDTAEVTRCCVLDDAPKGTPSYLYSRCWRIWQLMGGGKYGDVHAGHRIGSEPARGRLARGGTGDSRWMGSRQPQAGLATDLRTTETALASAGGRGGEGGAMICTRCGCETHVTVNGMCMVCSESSAYIATDTVLNMAVPRFVLKSIHDAVVSRAEAAERERDAAKTREEMMNEMMVSALDQRDAARADERARIVAYIHEKLHESTREWDLEDMAIYSALEDAIKRGDHHA